MTQMQRAEDFYEELKAIRNDFNRGKPVDAEEFNHAMWQIAVRLIT